MTKLYIGHFATVTYRPEVKHPRIADEPATVVIAVRFVKRTITIELGLEDVDRLLAVVDAAAYPVLDLAEFFEDAEGVPRPAAIRAAEAFVSCAGQLDLCV